MNKIILVLSAFCLQSCLDDAHNDVFRTFEDDTVFSLLEKQAERYSTFVKLLKTAHFDDLLSAYGTYTCFAPDNEAFEHYFTENGIDPDALTDEEIRILIGSHLLDMEYETKDFTSGPLAKASFSERFLTITISATTEQQTYYVNNALIALPDLKVHNGVVHGINAVIINNDMMLTDALEAEPEYSLFAEALRLTGLADSLSLINDKNYEQRVVYTTALDQYPYGRYWPTPPFRKFGYTIFATSNEILTKFDIRNIDDMKRYASSVYDEMYPEDKNRTDPTDRRNSLNRFIAYHLLDRSIAQSEFFSPVEIVLFTANSMVYDYIETLCPNTLIESNNENGHGLSFNKHRNGECIRIISPDHQALNGVFHGIDRPLTYDRSVEEDVLNKRLRIDFMHMIPEMFNNKLLFMEEQFYFLPQGYTNRCQWPDNGNVDVIMQVTKQWADYLANDLLVIGRYDFTMELPPVPPGTYEIRIRYHASDPYQRGVAQIYFDGTPCGIPLDMRIASSDPRIGYIRDDQTEDNGVENDKMMRNRGYMKDIDNFYLPYVMVIARNDASAMRRIIATRTFDKAEHHTIRVKCVEDRTANFHIDDIEFMPIGLISTEGRD
jgi:uncharacterized surface protein with fasciclin (FAS1) repeats